MRPISLLVPALLAASCLSGEAEFTAVPGAGPLGETMPIIFNGSPPTAPEHGAVVSLHQRSGSSVYTSPFCSGTLIRSDVVLTAAHCLDTARGGRTFSTMAPGSLAIYVGDRPATDLLSHVYGVVETVIHPSYDRRALRNDIALVRLARPITEAVTPVPELPASLGFSSADIGSLVDFAGFGDTEDGGFGEKLHVILPLGGLGCTVAGCPDGGQAATQVSYAQGVGGPCSGDSGGPLFLHRGGQSYVGGITSYGDAYCLYYGVSTRVDAYTAWIGAFAGAGEPPPPGDTDVTGDSCGNQTCDVGESCDGRSGTLACATDCAGRVGGRPGDRFCYVSGVCQGPGCP